MISQPIKSEHFRRQTAARYWFRPFVLRFFGLVFILSVGCKPDAKSPTAGKDAKPEPPTIRGIPLVVKPQSTPVYVRTQGSLLADEISTIGAKVPGRIVEVLVDLGDAVTKDQPLVKIDQQEYQLLVLQAEAQLTQARSAVGLKTGDPLSALNPDNAPPVREAKAVYNESQQNVGRIRRLAKQNAISETDLEAAEAAERVAEAKLASAQNSVREKIALISVQTALLDLAKQRLVETVTYAPFDGIIQNRTATPGAFVSTGQPLFSIVRNKVLRFRASVPERYAQKLAIGQKVILKLDRGKEREAKVSRISPSIEQQSRSLAFEADVDNEDQALRTGVFAEAEVIIDPEALGLAVPLKSVVRFAGVDKVFKVVDGMVKDQIVQLGRQIGDKVEILKGLVEGETILQDAAKARAGKFDPNPEPPKADS